MKHRPRTRRTRTSRCLLCPLAVLAVVSAPALVSAQTNTAGANEPGRVAELVDLMLQGELEEAWRFGTALQKELESDGSPSVELARTLLQLSKIVFDRYRERPTAGFELAERSLAMHEELLGPRHRWTLDARANYASTLVRQERLAEAERELRETLTAATEVLGPRSSLAAIASDILATTLQEGGRFDEARALYENALEAYSEERVQERGRVLLNLGVLLQRTGDNDASRHYLERAEALLLPELGPDHIYLAYVHQNLGVALGLLGRDEQARQHHEKALEVFRHNLGDDHPLVGGAWTDLAVLELQMGHVARAREGFENAARIYEQALGRGYNWAFPAAGLADILREAGERERARELYLGALEAFRTQVAPTHPQIVSVTERLAHLELDAGRRPAALELAEHGAELEYLQLRDTIGALSEREVLLALTSKQGISTLLARGLLSAKEDREAWAEALWDWTLSFRSLALEEIIARARNRAEKRPEVRSAWDELVSTRSELADVWNQGPSGDRDAFEQRLGALRAKKEAAERRLATLQDRPAIASERPTLSGLREHLPKDSAVVEVVRTTTRYANTGYEEAHDLALVLRADAAIGAIDLGSSRRLDQTVVAWRTALARSAEAALSGDITADAAASIAQAGQAVRTEVWDPIVQALPEMPELLFLSAEGALLDVDLDALPMGDGHYLAEVGPVLHQLNAARDLLRSVHHASPENRGALALGGPDYNARQEMLLAAADTSAPAPFRGDALDCRPASGSWRPLPESTRESVAVSALLEPLGDVLLLTGDRASEAMFKAHAPGKRILHLATHGFFFAEDCESSAQDAAPSPLLLSGLVLAGANRRPGSGSAGPEGENAGEDGILTAEEVATLPLDGVALAVLSGCETGLGVHADSEGVLGLRRAFETAGVETVVMSTWSVPDRRSRQLVTELYRHYAQGQPIPRALRAAKLSMLRRLRDEDSRSRDEDSRWRSPIHPYLWAGFVSAGDWR